MDITDLLASAPSLVRGLEDLGLSDANIGDLGLGIDSQLGGSDGFDFTDLLTGLDADRFIEKIDVASLARQVGISPEVVTAAIGLIAPAIAEFSGGGSALGKLGGLAKGLLGGSN